jgi:hypothetical protein
LGEHTISIFNTEDINVSEEHTVYISSPEYGYSMLLRNVDIYLRVYTASKPEEYHHHENLTSHELIVY